MSPGNSCPSARWAPSGKVQSADAGGPLSRPLTSALNPLISPTPRTNPISSCTR